MEGSKFEISLSTRKMKTEKPYREVILAMIVANICALLNSYGGKLCLNFDDNFGIEEEANDVLRSIEQCLINIIGLCIYTTHVEVPQLQKSRITKQLVITLKRMKSLCTVNYHLYLPTQKQVSAISPSSSLETVKDTLNREVCHKEQNPQILRFVQDEQVSLTESKSIQFKQLEDKKSKCVSLADRITNDSNKLSRHISAFANKDGGRIYYGITDDGTVKGEIMTEKDQDEIIRKVTTKINKIIWSAGNLERGKHWDIKFEPVKDNDTNTIPSLFVAIISVAPLPGGLFTKQPESYHVVQGRVEHMSFANWRSRFLYGTMEIVPSSIRRLKWSSARAQRMFHKVLQELVKYQNNADFVAFKKCVALAKQSFCDADMKLIILGERIVGAYKRGQFKKAYCRLQKFQKNLSSLDTKDYKVLEFRAVYARSAIARAEGDYRKSYKIIDQEGLQLAEMVPAGILTAWFYNQVAVVEKLLSQQVKEEAERAALVQSSLDHYIKALQHTQASIVEQQFSTTIADLQQRIYIFRAITLLGDSANGANFRKATPSDVKAAQTDLENYHSLYLQGYLPTNYRKVYHLFSLSDLRMCQWWDHLQQQTQEEGSSKNYKTPELLREAFNLAKKAKKLSREFKFEELFNNANKRLAVITEMMIKFNYVSSLRVRTK